MHEALLVARREYLERVRSRAFRVSTVLIPTVMAVIFGAGYLSGKVSGGPQHLVVVSNDAALAESVKAELLAASNADEPRRRDQSGLLSVDVQAPVAENDVESKA